MSLTTKPETNEVQTAQAVDPAAICSPLCPKCRRNDLMKLNLSTLLYSCERCVWTWSNNYLTGWNDGFNAVSDRSPLETSDVRWEYEDELPEMEDADFDAIFKSSRVDGVRLYPFVEDSKGNRIWITHLPSEANAKILPPREGHGATETNDDE